MKTKNDPAAVTGDRANIEYAAGGFDVPILEQASHRRGALGGAS